MCRTFWILLLFLIPCRAMPQIWPAEGSALHYRIIGFSFPATKDDKYTLEIAAGTFHTEDSFKKNIIGKITGTANKIVGEVPSFGRQYTWRVIDRTKDQGAANTSFHHFSTANTPNIDTAKMRFRVLEKAEKYKDAYVFLDGNRALYDMAGQPVWFLPDKEQFQNSNLEVRDLKLTPQGTITFLLQDKAYEISYNGDILWTGPNNGAVSGDKIEYYHHEFTRLANGHYMILGNEMLLCKMPVPNDSEAYIAQSNTPPDNTKIYKKVPFGTIIEYDATGNVVWSWKSSRYLSLVNLYKPAKGRGMADISAHENAFYFDEEGKTVFVSFRNTNQVYKIKYPGGDVLQVYGDDKPLSSQGGNGWFCRQHCCRRSQKGYLYLFNNNSCNPNSVPTLIMMEEPTDKKDQIKKMWEYACPIDGVQGDKQSLYQFPIGGNVVELPDRDLLVCMGGSYSKIFIMTPGKKILWSALPEKWNTDMQKWDALYQYRASLVNDHEQLEHLIWGGRANKE